MFTLPALVAETPVKMQSGSGFLHYGSCREAGRTVIRIHDECVKAPVRTTRKRAHAVSAPGGCGQEERPHPPGKLTAQKVNFKASWMKRASGV